MGTGAGTGTDTGKGPGTGTARARVKGTGTGMGTGTDAGRAGAGAGTGIGTGNGRGPRGIRDDGGPLGCDVLSRQNGPKRAAGPAGRPPLVRAAVIPPVQSTGKGPETDGTNAQRCLDKGVACAVHCARRMGNDAV